MSHQDWKSGTLLYLRQRFYVPFEALTFISHSMEEYYRKKLACVKVHKKANVHHYCVLSKKIFFTIIAILVYNRVTIRSFKRGI